MALSDRKMPIIADVNDIPSTISDPSHPNGSLMCSQYNALIDTELTAFQTAINNIPADTDDLDEGTTNKYYTDARFDTRLATKTTDNLTEGTTNKYFSNTLARNSISATTGTTGITYNATTGVFDFSNLQAGISDLTTFTTDDLNEGTTNKYFSNTLARNSISATVGTSGITYNATTGVFDFSNVQAGISDLNSFTTDDLIEGTTNKYFSNTLARNAISVTGNGTYNNTTGQITINSGVDHVTFVDNGNGTHTMTVWGNAGETINLGSTTLNDGADGSSITTQLITQAAYDALTPKNSNTLYIING